MPDQSGSTAAAPPTAEGNVDEAGTGTERYGVGPHPEFPTARTLLISYRRSRAFLERTARELLAGGTEFIMLSALGDAIPLAVQLQHALESKNAATTVRIETVLVQSPPKGNVSGAGGGGVSPGLHIVVQKHPEFRGSRISPGYVSFAKKTDERTPGYDRDPTEVFACVNGGTTDLCLSSGRREIAALLETEGFPTMTLKEVHASLLAKALEENHGKDDADVKAAMMREPANFPNVKLAVCRPCMALGGVHPSRALGAVFVTCFKDKFPYGEQKNAAMAYIVSPQLAHFSGDAKAYVEAVEATAANVMTVLCDFNGYVRREKQSTLPRISRCRITVFSREEKHRVSKSQLASAILRGLEKGYRHGPGPRLSFEYDDDVFRNAWIDMTGLDPTAPSAVEAHQEGDRGAADGRKK